MRRLGQKAPSVPVKDIGYILAVQFTRPKPPLAHNEVSRLMNSAVTLNPRLSYHAAS
jgi:hypothetical protein